MQEKQKLCEPASQSFLSYFHLVLQFCAIIWRKSSEFCGVSFGADYSISGFQEVIRDGKTLTYKIILNIMNLVDGRYLIGVADIFNPKSMQQKWCSTKELLVGGQR